MAPGRAIDDTEPLRIDALFLGIIVITLLYEKSMHALEHSLQGRTKRGLRHAVHHIQEELLALGLISFLLIVAEEYLLEICVDNDDYDPSYGGYGSDSYGSGNYPSDNYTSEEDGYRRRFWSRKLLAGYGSTCADDEEPFWSANTLHQTHLFIFLVACVHVLYATASILICLWRMRRWKKYERQPSHALKQLKNTSLVYGKNAFDYWFWSFWAQFSPSVDESLYLSMRCLFIERMEFPEDFDFYSFVVNTLVEEFAIVVRIHWAMWVVVAIWILVPSFLIVTTILAVLIVLLAGTKIEVVGVKLTQLAYLAYGSRGSALLLPIKAPSSFISKSVKQIARRVSHLSGNQDIEGSQPRLSTKSLSGHGRHARSGSDDLGRRSHSFEVENHVAFADDAAVPQANAATEVEMSPSPFDPDRNRNQADEDPELLSNPKSRWWCCIPVKDRHNTKASFSDKYNLPDSANLFWFKQPQLILKALRFVYFETSMAIAVVLFDTWQESDFIIEDIEFVHSRGLTMAVLIFVGILCLLHTSFLMLPTYALAMVAGSHCPERVLKIAKKMDVETAELSRIESLREKSLHTQMTALKNPNPLNVKTEVKAKNLGLHEGSNEKVVTSLVGAMYRGRLQRLVRQNSGGSHDLSEHNLRVHDRETRAGDAAGDMGYIGQTSQSNSFNDDEEMRGIEAIFGSFERFLEHLQHAQQSILQMNPSAQFNFDSQTGTYEGRDSTPFDRAAINLTWDLIAAEQDTINDDDA